MKVIVSFSGGKDSLAALLWTREHITNNFTTVFCDTGWEHPRCRAVCRVAERNGQLVRRRHGHELHELLRIMRMNSGVADFRNDK